MSNSLSKVLERIGEEYGDDMQGDSRFYVEVDIGEEAEKLGLSEVKEKYNDVKAIVPLKEAAKGMTVRIDGRTFVHYEQLESGVAVPNFVAKEAGLASKAFEANHSMILSFA